MDKTRQSPTRIRGRAERTDNRELIQGQDEPAYRVGKISLGAVRDFRVAPHLAVGAGGVFSLNFVPEALVPLYGGDHPAGSMAFVRIKLNQRDSCFIRRGGEARRPPKCRLLNIR